MNKYNHLSAEERAVIMIERQRGTSLRLIASLLGRSPSTLSRELNRNKTETDAYCATSASKAYRHRRRLSVKPHKIGANPVLREEIESHLTNRKWSPEQISALLKQRYPKQYFMHVSPETIYAHIYAYPKGELKKLLVQSLRRHKSKRGPRGTKDSCYSSLKIAPEQLFSNRPDEINSREIAGHWEGDLIIGAMNKSCIGTLVERKTGYLILSKMRSKSAQHVREGFETNMKNLPTFLRLSMTYDRGSEMAQHPIMSKHLDMKVYFADSHAPWQRGSNENINGLLRQFLPKGKDLSNYSQDELDHFSWLLNTRPRKRYCFKTPQQMMESELEGGLVSVALDS